MSDSKEQHGSGLWSEEQRREMRKLADRMETERPTLEQLVASGLYSGPMPLGVFQDYVLTMQEMKRVREGLGLSLADVAERSGIDKGAISRLESSHTNPTFQTMARYASSLGKGIKIVLEDLAPSEATTSTSPALAR